MKKNQDPKADDIEFLLRRFSSLRVAYIDEVKWSGSYVVLRYYLNLGMIRSFFLDRFFHKEQCLFHVFIILLLVYLVLLIFHFIWLCPLIAVTCSAASGVFLFYFLCFSPGFHLVVDNCMSTRWPRRRRFVLSLVTDFFTILCCRVKSALGCVIFLVPVLLQWSFGVPSSVGGRYICCRQLLFMIQIRSSSLHFSVEFCWCLS